MSNQTTTTIIEITDSVINKRWQIECSEMLNTNTIDNINEALSYFLRCLIADKEIDMKEALTICFIVETMKLRASQHALYIEIDEDIARKILNSAFRLYWKYPHTHYCAGKKAIVMYPW